MTSDKISLSFQQVSGLDEAPRAKKVTKLFLAHNHLSSLAGIEAFSRLTHLSLSHNRLQDIEELAKVRTELECLAVKGNFLDRHPDYKSLILRFFPRLKELDGI